MFAFAYRIPLETRVKDLPQKCGEAYGYPVSLKMHQVLLRLARMIEDYGYSAASYTESWQESAPALAAMTDLGNVLTRFPKICLAQALMMKGLRTGTLPASLSGRNEFRKVARR